MLFHFVPVPQLAVVVDVTLVDGPGKPLMEGGDRFAQQFAKQFFCKAEV
jgi:hypothetical protein